MCVLSLLWLSATSNIATWACVAIILRILEHFSGGGCIPQFFATLVCVDGDVSVRDSADADAAREGNVVLSVGYRLACILARERACLGSCA